MSILVDGIVQESVWASWADVTQNRSRYVKDFCDVMSAMSYLWWGCSQSLVKTILVTYRFYSIYSGSIVCSIRKEMCLEYR